MERIYDLPGDMAHNEVSASPAEDEQTATPRGTATLEEMNAKLDAILAMLSRVEG